MSVTRRFAVVLRTCLATAVLLASGPAVLAFSIPVHLRITNQELEPLRADVSGRSVGFSERALQQIDDANEGVDSIITLSAALFKPERHFTNEQYHDATQRLIDLRKEVIKLVTRQRRDGNTARERLGQALHTIQDFYSHSNWVELGNGSPNSDFGTRTLDNPLGSLMACPIDPNVLGPGGGGGSSSAYYLGILGCNEDELPAGKCFHGNYTNDCIGINKDLDAAGAAAEGVPQNPFHGQAVSVAREATRTFTQGILDDLAGDDKALAALLDVRGTFGFVIDDTGSMGPEISGVKSTVSRIVNFVSTNPQFSPDDYLLVRFGDPNVGSAFVTEDPSALLSAVSAISPSGGGDCPELAQAGLLEALDAAFVNSRLYFFSDASSKDASRANQVIARAQDKNIRIIYALTGSCSPIDPAYLRAAEETGGQVFLLSSSEIPLLFDLIRPQLLGDLSLVARRKGDLGIGGSISIPVPVDSTMTGLVVSVSVDSKNAVRLRRPSGDLVLAGDPGVTVAELFSGSIIDVEAPETGEWQVEISGSGGFTAAIQGNSPIQFDRFDFVRPNPAGDVHGGFFPIPGQPVTGSEGLGEATLLGPFATANFELVDASGVPFDSLALEQDFLFANPEHFLGSVDLPSVPFRISVSGLDPSGLPYQRQYPVVYRAQSVAVAVMGAPVLGVSPGSTVQVRFVVTNLGPSGAFVNTATDELGFVTSVRPSVVSLNPDESAEVTVTLRVPTGTEEGAASVITFTSTRGDDVSVFNSATAVATVTGGGAPDCSGAADVDVVLWPPDHGFESIDVVEAAGVTDPEGDEVTAEVLAITQDEPVDGLGSGDTAPDGGGLGTGVAEVRAERSGTGNGRVYAVSFRASDPSGNSCEGVLRVSVPHDQASVAVDDGQAFLSTDG